MAIVPANSNRKIVITTTDDGNTLDLGPASAGGQVGTFALQFNPSFDFVGQIVVEARLFGKAAQDAACSFLPVRYRAVNVNGLAADYSLIPDPITGGGIIQVPSNGLSIGLQVACAQGSMTVAVWDLEGSGAP